MMFSYAAPPVREPAFSKLFNIVSFFILRTILGGLVSTIPLSFEHLRAVYGSFIGTTLLFHCIVNIRPLGSRGRRISSSAAEPIINDSNRTMSLTLSVYLICYPSKHTLHNCKVRPGKAPKGKGMRNECGRIGNRRTVPDNDCSPREICWVRYLGKG